MLRVRVLGEGPIYEGTLEACAAAGCRIVEEPAVDLLVLANVRRILRAPEIDASRLGGLCFHPSLLPRHRGADAVYWTLQVGDRETGATWFWIDEGIDTGAIAIQERVAVPEDTSPGRLYYGTLVPLGLKLLADLLPQLIAGRRPSVAQDESLATYEPPRAARPA